MGGSFSRSGSFPFFSSEAAAAPAGGAPGEGSRAASLMSARAAGARGGGGDGRTAAGAGAAAAAAARGLWAAASNRRRHSAPARPPAAPRARSRPPRAPPGASGCRRACPQLRGSARARVLDRPPGSTAPARAPLARSAARRAAGRLGLGPGPGVKSGDPQRRRFRGGSWGRTPGRHVVGDLSLETRTPGPRGGVLWEGLDSGGRRAGGGSDAGIDPGFPSAETGGRAGDLGLGWWPLAFERPHGARTKLARGRECLLTVPALRVLQTPGDCLFGRLYDSTFPSSSCCDLILQE